MIKFEGQDRRQAKLDKVLAEYGFKSLEEVQELCLSKGINVEEIVKGIQPIAFENAVWAYTLGCAISIKKDVNLLLMLPKLLAWVYRLLQFRVQLAIQEKWVLVMVTSVLCF